MMIISLAAAVLIAAVVLFALNYPQLNDKNTSIKLADVSLTGSGDMAETDHNKGNVELKELEITPDNVQNVIAFLNRADSYHRVIKTTNYWQGGSAEYNIEVWNSAEGTRISVTQAGASETKNLLLKNQMLYVWYGRSGDFYSAKLVDSLGDMPHIADELQMIATYEDVLEMKKSGIADAGYAVIDGKQYIFVQTVADELENEDTYYISLENGLLEIAETKNNGETVYSMQTVSTEIAEPDVSLFTVPG